MLQLYLTVNYPAHQFQLAPIVPENDLSSNLIPLGTSNLNVCSSGKSINGAYIGVIVIGSILATILLAVLLLWIYKWRPAWRDMRNNAAAGVPTRTENEGLRLSNLEDVVTSLKESLASLETGVVRRHELANGHRPSDASFELASPISSREHPRLASIPSGDQIFSS